MCAQRDKRRRMERALEGDLEIWNETAGPLKGMTADKAGPQKGRTAERQDRGMEGPQTIFLNTADADAPTL